MSEDTENPAEQMLKAVDSLAENVGSISEQVESNADRIERLASGTAKSSQVDGGDSEEEEEDTATKFLKALGGRRLHKATRDGTLATARQANREALRKDGTVGLEELSGPQLPRDLFDRFIERTQRQSDWLDMIRVETLPRLEMGIPKIGVPEMAGGTRDEEGNRPETSDPTSGVVEFDATDQFYFIKYDLKEDAVKNLHATPDEIGNLILEHFERAWANDVQKIAIQSGYDEDFAVDYPDLDEKFTGHLAILAGEDDRSDRIGYDKTDDVDTAPGFSWGAVVETELFNDTIQSMPERARDDDSQAFFMSKSQLQQYYFELTDREDTAGVSHLYGENPVTPFGYDMVGIDYWPDDVVVLGDPENFAFGQFAEMAVEQQTETDKTMDEVLHSRNVIEGQFDFQVEELQNAVLVEDVEPPEITSGETA